MSSSESYIEKMHRADPKWDTQELINVFEGCVERIREAVDGLSPIETRKRPIEGKWSCLEVVCHLADTDIYFTDRIERTIAMDKPLLMGVDERPYPERLQFQEQDLDEELELIKLLRKRTARILRRQPESVWLRTAVHSEVGICTLRDLVVRSIRHVHHHLPFIEEKRSVILANRTATKVRKADEYQAKVKWVNDGPDFCNGQYPRHHKWIFDGGITVDASPSPHIVPLPWSNENAIDPEEALVASASSCHMLTFLFLASQRGWEILRYEDSAVGVMTKNFQGTPWVSEIRLQPQIEWASGKKPNEDEVKELHDLAHGECFIANSIKSRIKVHS